MSSTPYAPVPGPDQGPGTAYCYRHPDRATGLACTRCERPICPDCLNPASVGFQCPDCVREGAASVRRPSARKTALARSRSQGPVTFTLIGLNVLMFVVTAALAGSINDNWDSRLFFDLAMFGPALEAGEAWRLVSSTFLHYGLTHLAVNMLSLFLIGRDVEAVLGWWRYLAVYLLAGIGGSLAAYIFTPDSLVAGASGAVFGLLGAAGVIMLINKQDLRGLVTVLAINLMISLMPGISLAAHAGGLVVGALVTWLLVLQLRRSRIRR